MDRLTSVVLGTRRWMQPSHPGKRRRSVNAQGGQDLVETALIMPVFLLLVVGIIEFGLVILGYNSVASVAREGARYGVVRSHTAALTDDYATNDRAQGLNRCTNYGTADFVTVTMLESNTIVQVEVLCDWPLLAGSLIQGVGGSGTVQLHAISSMRRE